MNNVWWVKPSDLDQQQKNVIDLPLDQSHLIIGPPGSGKTNLLLLRGSQMVHSGRSDVLILVFTRTLREFLATGCQHYAFGLDKVQTLNTWTYNLLREYGVEADRSESFDDQRRRRIKQIHHLLADQELTQIYDAIILDEAQDYTQDELDIFLKLGKVIFAAADSHQQIYQSGSANIIEMRNNLFGERVYRLKYHYRNGQKICQVADELAKTHKDHTPLTPTSNYDEEKSPSSVEIIPARCFDEELNIIVNKLEYQLKAYPNEYLGILCPENAFLRKIYDQLQQTDLGRYCILQSSHDGYVPFENGKQICICTIHAAKGLEFRTVHLLDADKIKKSSFNRNIAYTAITRAKTSLTIYHTDAIPAYLERALSIFHPPMPPVTLEQLFKG